MKRLYRTLFPTAKNRAFHHQALGEILQERVASSRNRRDFRGVKRKTSNVPRRPASQAAIQSGAFGKPLERRNRLLMACDIAKFLAIAPRVTVIHRILLASSYPQLLP
jgi:hypothetical protein